MTPPPPPPPQVPPLHSAPPLLDAASWARLNPLLDQALDLPAAEREAWLAALAAPGEQAAADTAALRWLLAQHEAVGREDFLPASSLAAAASAAPPALGRGQHVGPWTIEAPLGEGGMASVWLAQRSDGRHDGQAAIKLMHGRLHGTQANHRFAREGRILARLQHPHIARLLDAGVTDDAQPYLVLELVRGQPIDRWCDERALDVPARLRLFVDVAQAVAAAHAQLVVHRDLKPGNVMVDEAGQVKLLDFGVARLLEDDDGAADSTLTRTGQHAFTPAWAAPEQLRGDNVSTAADVWALGLLLCHLLTGRHASGLPWASDLTAWMNAAAQPSTKRPSRLVAEGDDAVARASARATQPQRLVKALQGELDQIVLRALADEPDRRYASAQALADDVQRYLKNEPVAAHADTVGYRTAKFVRRNRLVVGAASTTLLVLVAGVLTTSWQAIEAQRQRAEAQVQRGQALQQREHAQSQAQRALQALAQADASAAEARSQRQRAEGERDRAELESARAELERARAQAQQQRATREGARADAAAVQARTERDRARRELELAEANTDFLESLLDQTGDKPFTSAELLARGTVLSETLFAQEPALRGAIQLSLASRYADAAQFPPSLALMNQAGAAAAAAGDDTLAAEIACAQGTVAAFSGDLVAGRALVDKGMALLKGVSSAIESKALPTCWLHSGWVAVGAGDAATARSSAAQGLALVRRDRPGQRMLISTLQGMSAEALSMSGDAAGATQAARAAQAELRATGRERTRVMATLLANESKYLQRQGRTLEALVPSTQGLAIADETGHPADSISQRMNHAVLLLATGRAAEASAAFERLLALAQERKQRRDEAFIDLLWGRTLIDLQQFDRSGELLDQAQAQMTALFPKGHRAFATVATTRAMLALARGDAASVRTHIDDAMRIFNASNERSNSLAKAMAVLARAEQRLHAQGRATISETAILDLAQQALALEKTFALAGSPSAGVGGAWVDLGAVHAAQGRPAAARQALEAALAQLLPSVGERAKLTLEARELLRDLPDTP